ncbi:Holo-[acyl-carrier-protein] synthase [bacterium HR36]|nr:Holo-[acyl-carrier-protein] synthase [bacterium HR36]
MRIFGIGTDIVECQRIARMLAKHGEVFLRRVFTEQEIAYCHQRKRAAEHFAGRWAAKEAVFKALGTGWAKGMCWTDIEIVHDHLGQPQVQVHGAVREYTEHKGIGGILVSISHCRQYATACAVAWLAGAGDHATDGVAGLSTYAVGAEPNPCTATSEVRESGSSHKQ